jgi:hypothetical protein
LAGGGTTLATVEHRLQLPNVLALCGALALGACSDDAGAGPSPDGTHARLDFGATLPSLGLGPYEGEPVEVTPGVILRMDTSYETAWELAASGIARGDFIEPIDDSGEISLLGSVTVDLYATVTLPGQEHDGFVGTQTLSFETEVSRFDPFLIDDPYQLGFDVPNEIEVRFDPASGVGLAFVIEMSISWLPTYEGKCLRIDDAAGVAQYTMDLQPIADIKHLFAVELVSAAGRVRLGQAGLDIDLVDLGANVDLGTLSTEDGTPMDEPGPCTP